MFHVKHFILSISAQCLTLRLCINEIVNNLFIILKPEDIFADNNPQEVISRCCNISATNRASTNFNDSIKIQKMFHVKHFL